MERAGTATAADQRQGRRATVAKVVAPVVGRVRTGRPAVSGLETRVAGWRGGRLLARDKSLCDQEPSLDND